jgi:Flp pilus assembly protein TadG
MIVNSRRKRTRRGSSILEFVLVGIPIIFVLISLFEISRGMWTYHTMGRCPGGS